MPCVHDFGIIEDFDPQNDYGDYNPKFYGCVAVDDDYLNDWWDSLSRMNTYFGTFARPEHGLARYAVTLIPPESLDILYDTVQSDPLLEERPDLPPLLRKIEQAKARGKWMIHYGV